VNEHFGYRDINALHTALFPFPDDLIIQAAFYGAILCDRFLFMISLFL
jgi:hypothetical protein